MWYRAAADLVLALHFVFVVFVVLGGLLALRWPRIAWIHVPIALYGAIIEFALARVHDGVVGNDPLRQRVVGGQKRTDRRADHRAGEIAHIADQPLYVIEILVERGDCVLAHWSNAFPGPRDAPQKQLSRNGR